MITSKYIDRIIVALVIVAVLFTAWGSYYAAASGLSSAGEDAGYATSVFDKDSVMQVNIAMDDDTFTEMVDNATDKDYYRCNVTINGTTYYNVGIRCKGNTSLSQVAATDSNRFSFMLKFDEYVDNQTCDGLDKLALNNIYADATYMKEYLSYDLMARMGVTSPLYSFSHITKNGEEWGLYLAVECLDKSFVKRNYGNDYGALFKVESTEARAAEIDGDTDDGQGDVAGNNNNNDNNNNNNNQQTMQQPAAGGQGGQGGQMPAMPDGAAAPGDNTGGAGGAPQMGQMPGADSTTGDTTSGDAAQQGGNAGGGGQGNMDQNGGGMGSMGSQTGTDFVYTDDDFDSYSGILGNARYEVSDAEKTKVVEAIKKLNEGEDLDDTVDVDQTLMYFAVNSFLVNDDDYMSNLCHNFFLYEKDGQLSTIPWDYNLAFGGMGGGSDATSSVNQAILYNSSTLSERPLLGKLLENDTYKQQYLDDMQAIITDYIDSGAFTETVNKVNAMIAPYVQQDATAFYTYDEYQTAVAQLTQFGTLRGQSVSQQLSGTIPASSDDRTDATTLVDASSVSLSAMGTMNGGGGGGQQGQVTQNANTGQMPDQAAAAQNDQSQNAASGNAPNGQNTQGDTGQGQNTQNGGPPTNGGGMGGGDSATQSTGGFDWSSLQGFIPSGIMLAVMAAGLVGMKLTRRRKFSSK